MVEIQEELDKIIQNICKKIEELVAKNYFSLDYIEKIKYRKHNKLHSRMLGIIVSAAIELGYIVDIGRGIKPSNGMKFNPDILFWKNGKPMILIEYESTNSSDYRVIDKDLVNYRRSVETSFSLELPKFWIIITTLPNKKVTSWSRWELLEWAKKFVELDKELPKQSKQHSFEKILYYKLKENPYSFYYEKFLSEFEKIDKRFFYKSQLFLVNLNSMGLNVEFPFKKTYPIKWSKI